MNEFPSPLADRRRLLLGLGAAGGALVGGRGPTAAATAPATGDNVAAAPPSAFTGQRQPFHGRHQAGVVTPRPAAGLMASFDVIATTPADLVRLFRTLTERAAFLTQGGAPPDLDPRFPPADSGILGPIVTLDNLTITVSVGASLFDDRYGLAAFKPARLQRMSRFRNDALDAGLCHGDLSVQFCANTPDTIIHALRDVVKNLPDLLVLRWLQQGSVPEMPVVAGEAPESARNFLGFRDGSANPNSADPALMDRLIWVQGGQDELAGPAMAPTRPCASSAISSSAGTGRRCASRSASSGARKPAARRSAAARNRACRTTGSIPRAR
jgi:deferrochelatase/peroxidase EfeB